MDETAAEFRAGLEAVRGPVIPVQPGRRPQIDIAGAGACDRGGRQFGEIGLADFPAREIHPVDAVPEGGDPKIALIQAEALDIEGGAARSGEGEILDGIVREVQQDQAAVFGAGQDMAVIDRDDRTDHVSGEVSAGAAAEMPGNEAPGVAVQGQAVVEHARPEVPLAVQEHGPDVLAGDGVRVRPVVGEWRW